MKLLSLFAGVGGFDLAFQRAGFAHAGMCEIDPHAMSVLNRHWPHVPKHDDVTTLTVDTFGPADIITFGSPCQDLSIAGRREGMAGERSGLFMEAVRIIKEMLEATSGAQPRFAVWENVVGAYSSNGGADFAAVLESLVGGTIRNPTDGWSTAGVAFGPAGSAEWRTLDSQHFGVPQRRRRIFLVYRPGGERAGEILFESSSVPGHPKPRSQARPSIAGALTSGFGSGGADDNSAQANHLIPVANTITTREGQRLDPTTETLVPLAFKVRGGKEGGGKGYLGSEGKTFTLDTTQSQYLAEPVAFVASDYSTGAYAPADKAGALTTSADRTRAAPIAFALRGREDGATPEVSGDRTNALRGAGGGSSRDYVAFAENSRAELRLEGGHGQVTGALSTGGGKPGQGTPTIATPYAVRRLTPKECERLQAFPDDWTRYTSDGTEVADTHRYRMMGNAVTVPVAQWIAHRLANALVCP